MAQENLTAADPRYAQMFDVGTSSANAGTAYEDGYCAAMNGLREQAPVMKGSPRGLLGLPEVDGSIGPARDSYTFLSFHACERGFRENTLFSSAIFKESRGIQALGRTILEMTGKEHKRHRAVAQPLFIRPRVLDWWKPRWIDEMVNVLLDRLQGQETADLNFDLCARLPMYVVTRAIGLEGEDALSFREHLTRSSYGYQDSTPEEQAASRAEVDRILKDLITRRRAQPGDDVITGMLRNDLKLPDGSTQKLPDEEIFAFCKLLIFAGGGTTWRQLGITIDALLTHYHFWEECVADRSLIEAAIDEALRWRPTDPYFPRLCMEDVEVEGVLVPAGSRVHLLLGAGNRDPKVWDRPDEFDIHRAKHHHMGLGLGPHRCLGMDVAKQEMVAAISGLMDRWPQLRIDPARPRPQFVGLDHRGMSAVTVRLAAGHAA